MSDSRREGVFAQETTRKRSTDELSYFRRHLNIDDEAQVQVAKRLMTPVGIPIKVYFAIEATTHYRQDLLTRIEKWNSKEARQYGALEVVDTSEKADLLLVRYLVRDGIPTRVASMPELQGAPELPNNVPPPDTMSLIPQYCYIVERTGKGLAIVRRDASWVYATDEARSAKGLWRGLTKLIKQRASLNTK
jgi:hypothetical protein